jgi:hypothetical protein
MTVWQIAVQWLTIGGTVAVAAFVLWAIGGAS